MHTTTLPAPPCSELPNEATLRAAIRRRITEQREACALAEVALAKEPRLAAMLLTGADADGAADLAVLLAAADR